MLAYSYLCRQKTKNKRKMTTSIVSQDSRAVTVRMSRRRWNRIQQLEQAYKLAHTIKRSMKQAETAPAMTVEQAINFIDRL